MKQQIILSHALLLGASSLYLGACGEAKHEIKGSEGALGAQCAPADLPPDAWVCPAPKAVECGVDPGTLFVPDSGETDCSNLSVSETGPFSVGTHTVGVNDSNGNVVCHSTLTVTDTSSPVITPKTVFLWPPNHKMHSIAVEDCVGIQDACQPDLKGEFVWASSDEPVDDLGDGHFGPDIAVDDCGHLQVRAERQGPKDGRVYKLGVRVVDSAGNATESSCQVIVDHDQRGVDGADSGESYRINFDGTNSAPLCDGSNTPPAGGDGDGDSTPPAGDGDSTPPAGDGDSTPPAGDGDSTPPAVDAGTPPSPL
jgi:hypothetical protein